MFGKIVSVTVTLLILCTLAFSQAAQPSVDPNQDAQVTIRPVAKLITKAVYDVLIEGQPAKAVFVYRSDNQVQTFICADPRPYTRINSSLTGWACYDWAIAVWLMEALPPAQQTQINQPVTPVTAPVQQEQPRTVVVYQPEYEPVYRPVVPGVGEVIVYGPYPYPVYSPRVVIARDSIYAAARVLSSRGGRRIYR